MALPFVLGFLPPTDADPYMNPCFEGDRSPITDAFSIQHKPTIDKLPAPDKSKLLYYVSNLTSVHWLCILPSVALDILAIAHGEGYLGFSYCYKIIARSWFIHNLTKLSWSFIQHYPQCLALQTRRYPLYGSLQLIQPLPVPFFTLTLDFVFVSR